MFEVEIDHIKASNEQRSEAVKWMMEANNVTIPQIAEYLGKTRQSIYQKFNRKMSIKNYFEFRKAIEEIVKSRIIEEAPVGIRVVLDEGAYMPERAHESDAGLDIRLKDRLVLSPQERATVSTGIHIAIPEGYVGFMKPKSGLFSKCGIFVEGTIDAGYTGEIGIMLENHSQQTHQFKAGEKICQLVIVPVHLAELVEVEELDQTDRGSGGFGSTGK